MVVLVRGDDTASATVTAFKSSTVSVNGKSASVGEPVPLSPPTEPAQAGDVAKALVDAGLSKSLAVRAMVRAAADADAPPKNPAAAAETALAFVQAATEAVDMSPREAAAVAGAAVSAAVVAARGSAAEAAEMAGSAARELAVAADLPAAEIAAAAGEAAGRAADQCRRLHRRRGPGGQPGRETEADHRIAKARHLAGRTI